MKKEKDIEDRKDLKKQRIRNYFLEAAKEIIINEGVENVTVRKVADLAGYSYATIYNYFEDVNELLWDVRSLFIKDIGEYMYSQINEPLYDKDSLKKLLGIYVAYYYEKPNVFKFFYFHRLNKPSKQAEATDAEPDFDAIWRETLKGFISDGIIQEKDVEVISKILIYSIHGMIAISFSYNGDLSEEKVNKDLAQIVEYLLK